MPGIFKVFSLNFTHFTTDLQRFPNLMFILCEKLSEKKNKDDPSSVVVVDFVVLPTTGRITRSFEKNLADSQVFHM
jgi:hypothetical protein